MERYILAIDHGTTSTRAVLFNHAQEIVDMSQRESTLDFRHPGWVEQDALAIWLDTVAVMADVLNKTGIQPSQIVAIGISNQRETSVIWDVKTGLPVAPAIVWQSRQTADICDRWRAAGYEDVVREHTGLRIDPYFSASKIAWLFEHVEGLRERAARGEVLFGTMDTWLTWRLSGGTAHVTDVSNASRTMLANIQTLAWDPELLEAFDVPAQMLPQIVATSGTLATTDASCFFGAEVPIASLVGDQQAALFGQLCLKPGMAKNTYGTGGFLLMNTGDTIVRSNNGLLSCVAWKIGNQVSYVLEGSIFVSASIMKWLRDSVRLIDTVATTSDMAEEAGTTGGVFIVPAFVGMGAPYWDARAKGAIFGLTFGTTKLELVRAALESMAYQARDVLEAMKADAGMPIEVLKVDGGASVNDFLLQFQADLCQLPVERFGLSELTALGAAYLAGLGVGFWQLDELSLTLERTFVPERPAPEMDERYRAWLQAVDACQSFKPLEA